MPKDTFPRSTPEAEGIPSSAILAFIDALEQHDHPLDAVHSFMLLRHGKVVAEGWWAPYQPDVPHTLYSLSKSFTSSAIGMAVAEGLLSVDDPVLKFFPDDAPPNPSDHLRAITIKHLLTMNTGHDEDTYWRVLLGNSQRAFLSQPVEHEPGTWFAYNSPATDMLSAIIAQITGEPLIDYLRPRLFDPLGIEHPAWVADRRGRSFGGRGLHITTDAIARFGQMYLQKGEWNGRRVLTESWVDEATAAHSDTSNTPMSPDWTVGYGYQFWRCRHNAYRGDGAFGQFCIVFPEQDAVLAMTSGVRDSQRVLDHVWEHLLPAFGNTALPEDAAAQATLAKKLASLSLPAAEGASTSGIARTVSGTTYMIEPNLLEIERIAFHFDVDPVIIDIEIERDAFHVDVDNDTVDAVRKQSVSAGYGVWLGGHSAIRVLEMEPYWVVDHGSQHTEASGAWITEDTFELRICYTEGEACQTLRFRFSEREIRVEVDPNVFWDYPLETNLTGHAAG